MIVPDCPFCRALAYQPAPYHAEPDETITCPKCDKKNSDDARYCDQCGFKLVGATNVGH